MPPLPKPLTSNNSRSNIHAKACPATAVARVSASRNRGGTRKRVPQLRWHAKACPATAGKISTSQIHAKACPATAVARVSASRERGNPHPPVAGALRSSARFTETERSRATSPPCPDQRQEYKEQSFLSQRYVAALNGGAPNHQIQRAKENQLKARERPPSSACARHLVCS